MRAPGAHPGPSATADALGIDPTGNPSDNKSIWQTFFRLLGDVDGNGLVTGPYTNAGTDAYAVYHTEGQSGSLLRTDVDGSGAVNSQDLNDTVAAKGHAVGAVAPSNFPQFQLFNGARGQSPAVAVTLAEVEALLTLAVGKWAAAGLDPADVRQLEGVQVQVGDLGSSILSLEAAGTILINQTAAGSSWYLDTATGLIPSYGQTGPDGEQIARTSSPAAGRVDLLTVLEHELGHIIGLPDNNQAGDLMDITLGLGVRREPSAADLAMAERGGNPVIPTNPSALVDRRDVDPVATTSRSLETSPAIGAGPTPLLNPNVSKATVDAALESLMTIAGENGEDRGGVPGLVATSAPAWVAGSGVIMTGTDQILQSPVTSPRFLISRVRPRAFAWPRRPPSASKIPRTDRP